MDMIEDMDMIESYVRKVSSILISCIKVSNILHHLAPRGDPSAILKC